MSIKSIVSLSGGIDSATVLASTLDAGEDVRAVAFDYGSKHGLYELTAAEQIAGHYQIPLQVLDLTHIFKHFDSNLLKTGGDIPEGHYEDDSMVLTVVPARNIIFASILVGYAWTQEASYVHLGVHAGDHAIYPDCRPDFYSAMSQAVHLGTDGRIGLTAPFLHKNKAEIVKIGTELKVPYHLTRTCYKEQLVPCGLCGACQERKEAFALNEIQDPYYYENKENALKRTSASKPDKCN